jgi:RNA polymerase sigma-70 factor (ECF subfamily)
VAVSIEGFGAPDCHVIVKPTATGVEMTGAGATKVERSERHADAFERLADRHLGAAYRLARAILHDPSEAQDATHDAFVQAWRKWSTLRDPDRFEAWFDRILVNTCRNRLQRAARWQTRDISGELALVGGDEFAVAHQRDAIATALARLSPDQRVVVALRYYVDLTVDEIAARLGIPSGTVHSRLHYALRRLRQLINDAEREEPAR